ncbi:MAG: phosphate ABC transporter substrate-binding protein PstS [Bryobacteraceae bacterium]
MFLISKQLRRLAPAAAATALAVVLTSCGGGSGTGKTAENGSDGDVVHLKAGGATLPLIAYNKWFEQFKKDNPTVDLQYQAVGSGEGLKMLQKGEIDFAASEIPLTDAEMQGFKVKPLHLPMLVGAIVPVYNLPGVTAELKFTGDVLAKIFLGRIKKWNDPLLAKTNAGVTLPAEDIVVFHRAGASGTSYVLSDYLSKVSPEWKKGAATVKWAGQAATGSEGVAAAVKSTPYALSYVEVNFAEQSKLSFGSVKNAAGKFVKAGLEAEGAAADAAQNMGDDMRASITNPSGANAYPICTFTWFIVPPPDEPKKAAIRHFLQWSMDKGVKLAGPLDYAMLPPAIIEAVKDKVDKLR